MAESVEHLWTNADLAAALIQSRRLPGEPDGTPPWPDYLDETYRRQTAARILCKRAVTSPECFEPLAFVANRDDDLEVRLRCLRELFEARYPHIERLFVALSHDSAEAIRQLSLEGLLLLNCSSIRNVAERLATDIDPDIREQARCILATGSCQLWRL
jgi:hypothetical protein